MPHARWTLALGFFVGLGLGCTTAAVVAQDSAPTAAAAPLAPTVIAHADVQPRLAPNGKARVYPYARGHNAFIGRLELEPGAAVPEHRDPTEEYIVVLEGAGTMHIDDVEYAVAPGAAIFMPAHAKVRFQNGDARMVALQIFAGPEPAAKYDAWTPAPP